jgi:hypothetical protein
MDVQLLWTFFDHRIQPLRQRTTKMWLYPGQSDLDRSFAEELSDVEINTRILIALDYGANLNPRADPAPLRECVASSRVNLFRSVFAACTISFSYRAHDMFGSITFS